MILVPLISLLLGILLALLWHHPITNFQAQYVAVACLAGLDTICGGIRSGLEGKFRNDVFFTGFLSNVIIAFFLAWLGDKIGIDLTLAVALVLGGRTFINLSLIRRFIVTRVSDSRERRRLERLAAAATTSTNPAASGSGPAIGQVDSGA